MARTINLFLCFILLALISTKSFASEKMLVCHYEYKQKDYPYTEERYPYYWIKQPMTNKITTLIDSKGVSHQVTVEITETGIKLYNSTMSRYTVDGQPVHDIEIYINRFTGVFSSPWADMGTCEFETVKRKF